MAWLVDLTHGRGQLKWDAAAEPPKHTLVTYTQSGHSYPLRPGALPSGGICATIVITASHREHQKSPRACRANYFRKLS
jgi:hypothetical protein